MLKKIYVFQMIIKDMTLNELLESDLSLEDIDEVIEEQVENER